MALSSLQLCSIFCPGCRIPKESCDVIQGCVVPVYKKGISVWLCFFPCTLCCHFSLSGGTLTFAVGNKRPIHCNAIGVLHCGGNEFCPQCYHQQLSGSSMLGFYNYQYFWTIKFMLTRAVIFLEIP